MPSPLFLADPYDAGPFTWAEPKDGLPFTSLLKEMADARFSLSSDAAREAEARGAARELLIGNFSETMRAAERQTRLVDTFTASGNALEEAADRRIAIARDLTGVQLENPFRQGYHFEARRRVEDAIARGEDVPQRGPRILEEQRRIFAEKMDELAQNFPDKAQALQFFQPLEDQAKAIAAAAVHDGEQTHGGFVPAILGGLYGLRRDPLFVGSLFFGPGEGAAATALGRIGWAALKQGLFNVGLTAVEQPSVQAWRKEIGARNGVQPALENVGLAFLFGAIPGAGIQGAVELSRAGKAAAERVVAGKPQPGDVELVAKEAGITIDNASRAALKRAEAEIGADRVATGKPPPGVDPVQHQELIDQAIRHGEDPLHEPPPELPIAAPARPADQVKIVDERIPVDVGARETVAGKPVTFERFDPAQLKTDAATFQYKGGGDSSGVTDRLKNVTQWDPIASGKAIIWERTDGERFIADGHQRLALARRVGTAETRIDGFLLREADGWAPRDVRALAAKKNLQEGSGDALDAARILRERPDIMDGALPVSSPMMKSAMALARLSDEAWGMALNGVVPPNHAAAVGAMVPDRLQHAAVLADLSRFAPATEREAKVMIGEIMAAGFRAEEQINLFGAATATRSLMGERVKVLDGALKGLVQDKRLFGTLAEKADAIEAAGNQLARGVNETRARDAAALTDMLVRLAQRTGPVSDALNRAAADVAAGKKTAKAADTFLEDVRGLLDRDGLKGLLAEPELRPRAAVEPGTAEASRIAEGGLFERLESPVSPPHGSATPLAGGELPNQRAALSHGEASQPKAAEPSLAEAVALPQRDGSGTRLISREAALEEADRTAFHADLVKTCKD